MMMDAYNGSAWINLSFYLIGVVVVKFESWGNCWGKTSGVKGEKAG